VRPDSTDRHDQLIDHRSNTMDHHPHIAASASTHGARRRLLTALLVAVACSLAACGADDSAEPAPSTDEVTASGPSATGATTTTRDAATTTATTVAVPATTVDATTTVAVPTTVDATTTSEATADVVCRPVTFPSGGRDLPGERCDPPDETGQTPRPAAVILGGCAVYEGDPLTLQRGIASALATAGVTALMVDYHAAAPPPTPETYCQPSPETIAAVPAMLAAVTDAAAWLRADPSVDGAAIGAVGYSLGGLFAAYAHLGDVDLASVPPASFSAIAMLAAPMLPDALDAARAGRMPPLYLLHGETDDVVAVDDSKQLAAAAQAGGTEATLVVVPAMDHGWSEPYASAERNGAIADVTDFITTRLEPGG
jgi:dienelactone hydrolase